MIDRLTASSESLLERRTSRRGFFGRLALAGSALSVGPLRYMLRPVSAWAVIRPRDCGRDRLCRDGWTEFCCSIERGRNSCPEGTFVGGWWKCTHYRGSKLCGNEGVRYYIDCNFERGEGEPCRCAHNDCSHRRIACNVFRYGQCNTQVKGKTAILCRVVTCVNPASIPELNCNATYLQDNETCRHEQGCLSKRNARIIGPSPGA